MVRGLFQGPAATDPDAAGILMECLYGLVVDRGLEAKPVREPLPLRLPRGAAEQALTEEPTTDVPITPTTNGAKPPATPPPSSGRRPSPRPRR
jgi:hypothetical protein